MRCCQEKRPSGVASFEKIGIGTLALLLFVFGCLLSATTSYAQSAPTVSSVSVPANGYYKAGDVLTFHVDFSETVTVNTAGGTPRVALAIGSATRFAHYTSGSGTTALSFSYTVQAGEIDLDGIQVGAAIQANGGTIENLGGTVSADLVLNNVAFTGGIFVYAVAPTVLSTQVAGNPPSNASNVTFEIVFSETVTGFALGDLSLVATGAVSGTLSTLQTTDNIRYTVNAALAGVGALRLDVRQNAAVNIAGEGNPAYASGTPWNRLSSNADLSQLQPSEGTLTPAFDPNILGYAISVANDVTEITLTPSVADPNATIQVNGSTIASGSASAAIPLPVATTEIAVDVTAQDGTTVKTYKVNVTRAASAIADLAGLVPSVGTFDPSFSPNVLVYSLDVSNDVETITLTPTSADATITINGAAVASGSASAPLPLIEGTTEISVVATAQDGVATQTYTVNVVRQKPAPIAVSRTVEVQAGTTANVDLTEGASGGPFTAAAITFVSNPDAGDLRLDAQRLIFDASPTFSGSTQVGFALSNAFGTSSPAMITFTVIARPDPSKDSEVIGLLQAQVDAAKRFAKTQTENFNTRLEQLHDEGDRRRNSMSVNVGVAERDSNQTAYAEQKENDPVADAFQRMDAGNRKAKKPGSDSDAYNPLGNFAIWSGGYVHFAEGNNGNIDLDSTLVGVSAGVDYRFSPSFAAGLGFGYGRDKTDVGENGTESRARAWSMAAYGSYKPLPEIFIDGVIGYGLMDFDSRRFVAATGDIVTGSRDGQQVFGSLSAGYEYRQDGWLVSPYGRLEASRSKLDEFAETGGGIWGLTYGDQTMDTLSGVLGLRLEYAIAMDWGVLKPRTRLEYTHDFEGSSRASLGYSDIGTLPYALDIGPLSRDYLTVGLGFDALVGEGWNLGFDYRTAYGSGGNSRDHTFAVRAGTMF